MSGTQQKWDARYRQHDVDWPVAADVLTQNQHLLPDSGKALDLACGLGGNALLLAETGLAVTAQDVSPVAIDKLQIIAQKRGLQINAEVRDVLVTLPAAAQYNVIVVSYYLERVLAPVIMHALKPGGVLFYQTWCRQKVADKGPTNPDYLLADNELLTLFADLKLRVYREEALLGDKSQGFRNVAMLVAERCA